MTKQINTKIVGYAVKKAEEEQAALTAPAPVAPVTMSEQIERSDCLIGATYKIKPPVADHAMYITINDVILNEGTEHEERRPYEVFINSKAVEHFQWVVALTRVLSAVFRKGGDIAFITEELLSVYDPNGGYFKKGGVFMNSLVAEIGYVIERHLKAIGMIEDTSLPEATKAVLAEKRANVEQRDETAEEGDFPPNATVCSKCHTKAVIVDNGCAVCLNCADSACQ